MACWNTSIKKLNNGKIYIDAGDRSHSYYGKFWVAKITGTDEAYGLARKFINQSDSAVIETDGFYEVYRTCTWAKHPEHYFIEVKDNNYKIVSKEDILSQL